jgi:hypothetical protein
VAIETSRGLLVAVLRQGKREVFAINPMAAARYRDRHSVSRKKSDSGDALVLANILRTDMHAHRPLPNDSDLARAIAVLARAQQDATWNRQQLSNQLRSLLREYFPAALAAFEPWKNGLCRPEARELLKAAPTAALAARLTCTQLRSALKRAGRQRGIDAEAERLRHVFRGDWAHQPSLVEDALDKQMLALLVQLDAACTAADDLEMAVQKAFPQHPDTERSSLDVISFGESSVADEGASDAGEGQEVFGLALVAAVQSAASGEPEHRSFDGPTVAAQAGGGLDALAGDAVPDAAPA